MKIVGLIISLLFLGALFVWIPVDDVLEALLQIDPLMIVLAALCTFVNLYLRGIRWYLLGRESSAARVGSAVRISSIGLAINAVLPGKVGELAKVGMTSRTWGIGLPRAGAILVTERVTDGVVLLAIASVFLWSSASVGALALEDGKGLSAAVRSMAVLTGFVVIVTLLLASPPLNRWLRSVVLKIVPGSAVARKISHIVSEIGVGLRSATSPWQIVAAYSLTLVMWVMLAAGALLLAGGSDLLSLTISEAMLLTAVTVIFSAAPSAPGAWGIFEAAGVMVILSLGIAEEGPPALAFVLTLHLVQYAPVVIAGFLANLGWSGRVS
ncbi:MAG: lysylphosphatidylglycerol synthase transmembrane domain-containing protein [Xanthomonadales bacterium]|nr:lysylphosphatidylglycerol synthase transmembrane domain-containing protein [Xanthomonadales bacterium]